jgi:hypothetical protein
MATARGLRESYYLLTLFVWMSLSRLQAGGNVAEHLAGRDHAIAQGWF